MANALGVLSITIEDEPGEKQAMPLYFEIVDTTTLAALITDLGTTIGLVDAITDGLITRARAIIEVTLPGGLKSAAATGSDNEETGLYTFNLTAPSNKAFAVDVPAVAQATLVSSDKNKINLLTNTDVTAFINHITGSTTPEFFNNVWSTTLASIRTGLKTFRKHRRAAKRT